MFYSDWPPLLYFIKTRSFILFFLYNKIILCFNFQKKEFRNIANFLVDFFVMFKFPTQYHSLINTTSLKNKGEKIFVKSGSI